MQTEKVISLVMQELLRAEEIHPKWPTDLVRAAANVSEEAGELVQAVNNHDEKPEVGKAAIVTEAVQTAATALRFLKNIKE